MQRRCVLKDSFIVHGTVDIFTELFYNNLDKMKGGQ